MIARLVTLGNVQVGFLAAQPNWSTEVVITLELPTDIAKEPITFNEARRNFAQSARYKMEWTSYMSNASDSTELRIFLQRIRGETVVVPLWPDACETARSHAVGSTNILLYDLPVRYGSTWVIATDNFALFEFVTVQTVNTGTKIAHLQIGLRNAYPQGAQLYPLIFGRFNERPKPTAISDETLEVDFDVKENSDFAHRITPRTTALQTVGAHIPAFATTLKWNMMPNHSRPLDWTEMPDVVYEQIGFLRQEQQREYDHRTPRGQELEFYESDRANIAKIEYFWRDRRATTLRFMIPTFRGDLRMLYDTPAPGQPTAIRCEKNYYSTPGREVEPGDPYVCLISPTGVVDPYQLSRSVDYPAETRLLATQAVSAHTASNTILSHLLLARFAEATLQWTYTTPYLGTTRIRFVELPHEYVNTPVALREPAYLFIFKEGGIRTYLYTSYENTIRIPSGTYLGTYVPAPFSFESVKTGIRLDQEKLDFKSFRFTDNPLNKMWPFALDAILTLEIVEVNAANPGSNTAISRFYGDVWSIDSDYKATAVPFGNLFDRKFPRFLLSVSDNYTQFSPPTHLSPTSFRIAATIHGAVNHTSQTLLVTSASGHAKAANYFAGGWIETGVGRNLEKRGILSSTATGANDVTLTIDRPLLKAANNQALSVYPGYDGSIDECETKFNNRVNFGGHPFIPNVNPGVKAMKPKDTAGGKKV